MTMKFMMLVEVTRIGVMWDKNLELASQLVAASGAVDTMMKIRVTMGGIILLGRSLSELPWPTHLKLHLIDIILKEIMMLLIL